MSQNKCGTVLHRGSEAPGCQLQHEPQCISRVAMSSGVPNPYFRLKQAQSVVSDYKLSSVA